MLQSLVSPLAPAAILLLSAFILPILPSPSDRTKSDPWLRYVNAPLLTGLALLVLLVIRITTGTGAGREGLETLSGWDFLTSDSVAALSIRADTLSLSFLVVTLLTLLVVTMGPGRQHGSLPSGRRRVSGWLLLGAAACFLFVAANRLTIVYGVMAFDLVTAGYWLARGHKDLTTARLGLGLVTAAGLILSTPSAAVAPTAVGQLLLGLALWLRLGLFPLSEATAQATWTTDERLIYFGLSVTAGLYLAVRTVGQPLPAAIQWLVLLTMLIGGLLAWLSGLFGGMDEPSETSTPAGILPDRLSPLLWLILTDLLIVLLAVPLSTDVAAGLAMGSLLSLLALWVTPKLGNLHSGEGAQLWSWSYLPALMATLTLVGVPLTLGWQARGDFFRLWLLSAENGTGSVLLIIIARGLALSSLVHYWVLLVKRGSQHSLHSLHSLRSLVNLVMLVPFLTPLVGPFLLTTMIRTELILPDPTVYFWSLAASALILVLAVLAGYYRRQIVRRVEILAVLYGFLSNWSWLSSLDRLLSRASRAVLRMQIILEGQHYVGWAVFAALVGSLIILLS